MPMDLSQDCRCPKCLKEVVKEKIADFIEASHVENISPVIPKRYLNNSAQPIEEIDYYMENGRLVFTEWYHLKRGYCCGNNCRHCPYNHENVKPNDEPA